MPAGTVPRPGAKHLNLLPAGIVYDDPVPERFSGEFKPNIRRRIKEIGEVLGELCSSRYLRFILKGGRLTRRE